MSERAESEHESKIIRNQEEPAVTKAPEQDLEALEKAMLQYTEKNFKLLAVDMKEDMLKETVMKTENALEKFELPVEIAEFIKNGLDNMFLPPWHVVVGRKFACRATNEVGTLAYFILGDMAFFIFRGMEE